MNMSEVDKQIIKVNYYDWKNMPKDYDGLLFGWYEDNVCKLLEDVIEKNEWEKYEKKILNWVKDEFDAQHLCKTAAINVYALLKVEKLGLGG